MINEFVAINRHGLLDQDGDASDWLELYNPSSNTVNLVNWYLTDDASDLRKWQFPEANLVSRSYLLVFASGKNRRIPGAELHELTPKSVSLEQHNADVQNHVEAFLKRHPLKF